MSDTVRSLSTSGLTPKKQLQTWSDALTDLCGQFDIDPLEASSLEARINYTTVSQLKLCQIEASQHRIAHTVSGTKLSEHPYVKILFQTYGISHFEQSGRRIDIMPGDCLAYDVSCPHTIVSPSLTRHEVVIVPKELLHERGFRTSKMLPCKLSARNGTGRIAYDFVHTAFDEANKLFDVWDRDRTPRQRYVSSRYWLPIIEGRGDPGPAFGFTTERKAAPPRFNGS